jgi:PfaD family protein
MRAALFDLRQPLYALKHEGKGVAFGLGGVATLSADIHAFKGALILAAAPAQRISQLGDPAFCIDHGVRFPYMTGSMANGIASADLVIAAARAGVLGSFGAAGLRVQKIEAAIDRLTAELDDLPFCFNLIHSPNESAHELAVVELYLKRRIHLVEAAAFMDLTLPAVLYRVHGIYRDDHGAIITPNRIIAKVSRQEVATKWFSPPPATLLAQLVAQHRITNDQAALAAQIPMAQDLTAEADSAGHTDNRPALTLLPTMLALRDRLQEQFAYATPLRVGLGGGIGTPASAAAAFAMGAAYIVTGSVNQACIESGSSDKVRTMLAQVQQADVIMAPAADMFEMGVKLQVIKRGTMFPMRAAKLFEVYRAYPGLEAVPAAERESLEKTIFREPLDSIWAKTCEFFQQIDPSHIERAERDPKHKMALIFRWYLGLSSRWANVGDAARQVDYQIWCGPAMGAFNEWTKGSFLETPAHRQVATVALNLLYGAGVTARINHLRNQGVRLHTELMRVSPQPVEAFANQLQ